MNKKSFTLIELMVSLSILVVVMLAASAIYIRVIGTRGDTIGQLNIQEDGQFLMSLIAKDVRASRIDYSNHGDYCDAISDSATAVKNLCLKKVATGNEVVYKKDTIGNQENEVVKKCEAVDCQDGDFEALSMSKLDIKKLDFYIKPDSQPFTVGSTTYIHPRVTIVLKLQSTDKKDPSPLLLQQTIPQRYGLRK